MGTMRVEIEPRVLLVWGQYPRWLPPVRFSTRQVTLAARTKDGILDQSGHAFNYFEPFEPELWLERGRFDLADLCERAGLGLDFDYVIVFAEEDMGVFPTNLSRFRCPTILLVGDTHHFPRPLSTLLEYTRSESFQWIVGQFAAHHLHWFIKAGLGTCAWVPGLAVKHVPGEWRDQRDDVVSMVGHTWPYHQRRHSLLAVMRDRDLPLNVSIGTREEAAEVYGRSLISFNCSLNSDVNHRTLEVLSSRGFLLTDRLPEVTGLSEMVPPGEACDTYGDEEELIDKIRFYRTHQAVALELARRGHRIFCDRLAPDRALETFRAMCFQEDAKAIHLPPDHRCYNPNRLAWERRLQVYEDIQELHRQRMRVRVLVSSDATWFDAEDYIDLPRVELSSEAPRPGCAAIDPSRERPADEIWDYVVRG
jgi:hypothetical protein